MYEKFEKIIKERRITPYRIWKDTGIPQSCLSDWKSRKSTPRVEKLVKLSNYLGVPIEDLIDTDRKDD